MHFNVIYTAHYNKTKDALQTGIACWFWTINYLLLTVAVFRTVNEWPGNISKSARKLPTNFKQLYNLHKTEKDARRELFEITPWLGFSLADWIYD